MITREYEANRDLVAKVSAHSRALPRAMDPQDYDSEYRYQNDGLGRRTRVAEDWTTGDCWASNYWYCNYGYNGRSEVASARHWLDLATDVPVTNRNRDYAYDPIGNRLTNLVGTAVVTYAANELNQYTGITGAAPERLWYDDDGNLTNDGSFAYAWDGENRMVLAEPLGPGAGAKRVRSAYDHMGRRVKKAVDMWDGSAWVGYSTNRFVYDGWNLIQEVAVLPSTVQTNWFVWGLDLSGTMQGAGGIGGLLAQVRCVDGGADVWTYRYDANGNVCEVLGTNKHALTVAHYEYDPFGAVAQEWPPAPYAAFTNQFRFSTKYVDDETGLSYYGYRFYSPTLGRWLSRDPIAEEAFVLQHLQDGMPESASDPFGPYVPGDEDHDPVYAVDIGRALLVNMPSDGTLYVFLRNAPVNLWDFLGLVDLNKFPAKESIKGYADKAKTTDGSFSVGAHGNSTKVVDDKGNAIAPKDLAKEILKHTAVRFNFRRC